MSTELSLLKFFCTTRAVENANWGYVKSLDNLERELKLLFNLVHGYYKEFDKDSISQAELLGYYDLKYPKAKERGMHIDLINESFSSIITDELMKAHVDQLLERHSATAIINKLLPVMEGEKYGVLHDIRLDIDEYTSLLNNPPDSLIVPVPCELSVEELIEQEIEDAGLSWFLKELTEIIGGGRKKTLGLIYAFVDSGKTSFSMSAAAHFAAQLIGTDDTICYCGNEESAGRLRLRLVQTFTHWSRTQVKEQGKRAGQIAKEGGIDHVKIFDNVTSTNQLEYILKEYKPHIMFVDQATGIDMEGKKKEEGVAKLETLFKWFRRTSNIHNCGIVGIAQGVGEAEDTKYLKLSDIYGARVAIQGALDWAVGIGRKVNNAVDEDLRYIHVPKNKLHDGDSGKFAVHFNKYLNLWEVN